jgi:hypothetical protein
MNSQKSNFHKIRHSCEPRIVSGAGAEIQAFLKNILNSRVRGNGGSTTYPKVQFGQDCFK